MIAVIIFIVQNCDFMKNYTDTAPHAYFAGNLRIHGCDGCCSRWYFTFNGAECSGPLPIDAVLWIKNSDGDNHLPGSIEGYCDNIDKGNIRVGINIGNCPSWGNSNGYTGWNSVSRLIIEELSQSQ